MICCVVFMIPSPEAPFSERQEVGSGAVKDENSRAPLGTADVPSWLHVQDSLDTWARNLDMPQHPGEIVYRSRFTKEQTYILLHEIKARYAKLYGDGGPPIPSIRRQAWEEVAAAVNRARCGPTKTAAACIKRFNDFRRRNKKAIYHGPVITSAFSQASPAGPDILPSVKTEPLESSEDSVIGQ